MKLHVFLRNAGIASRRGAEELIAQGRVMVDDIRGEIGQQITGSEKIEVGGKIVRVNEQDASVYYLVYKPAGYTSTTATFANEHSVLELLPFALRKRQWQIAGRLDRESTGLMLLTNNGRAVLVLTHPRYEIEKEYEVILEHPLSSRDMSMLRQGIKTREGETYTIKRISLSHGKLYIMVLTEGKKREIREAMKAIGNEVTSLKRRRIGTLILGTLKEGQIRKLTTQEREELERYVEKLAAQFQKGSFMPSKRTSFQRRRGKTSSR